MLSGQSFLCGYSFSLGKFALKSGFSLFLASLGDYFLSFVGEKEGTWPALSLLYYLPVGGFSSSSAFSLCKASVFITVFLVWGCLWGYCFSQGFVSAALGQHKGCLWLTNDKPGAELRWPPQVGQKLSEGLQTTQSTASKKTSECRLLRKRGLEDVMGTIIFSSSWLMNTGGLLGQEE